MTDENTTLLRELCREDPDAMAFINAWTQWCHGIDDIIDGDRDSKEDILRAFTQGIIVCSCPFYRNHVGLLQGVALATASAYADSVAFEGSADEIKRKWADFRRHAGRDMLMVVAMIVGGWEHARAMSAKQWDLCIKQQHQE